MAEAAQAKAAANTLGNPNTSGRMAEAAQAKAAADALGNPTTKHSVPIGPKPGKRRRQPTPWETPTQARREWEAPKRT